MNGVLASLGLAAWKPVLTAFLLPPTPWLLLLFLGVALLRRRPRRARLLIGVTALMVWLSGCSVVAAFLADCLLPVTTPLSAAQMSEMRLHAKGPVAIIVLGAGVEDWAPEYGGSSLASGSLERLRYGIWLARRTGWPVGFSGGLGWAQPASTSKTVSEAATAQKIATEEWGSPLRWEEAHSRDTYENAVRTVEMLSPKGIRRIVLVTHRWHMPRAVLDFERAAGGSIRIEAASMGFASGQELLFLRWVPSGEGLTLTRQVIRERLGLLFGS